MLSEYSNLIQSANYTKMFIDALHHYAIYQLNAFIFDHAI